MAAIHSGDAHVHESRETVALKTELARLRRRAAELEAAALALPQSADALPRSETRECHIRNITPRTNAEAQVRLQSAALNAAANTIVIIDRAGVIQWVNEAFADLTGYTSAEAIGKNLLELQTAEHDDPASCQSIRDAMRDGQPWHGEMVSRRKNGSLYTEDHAITPVRDAHGAISHFVAIRQDITERRRGDEEIRARTELSALRSAIGLSLTGADSLDRTLQQCAEALIAHLEGALARIWTLNELDGVLELQASAGLSTHLHGSQSRVLLGQFTIGRIAQRRRPHLTNTVIGDLEVDDQAWARQEAMVGFAGYPLIVAERVVGVMALFARQPLPDTVMSALASVADHLAVGIERHRSTEALRVAEERTRFALEAAGVGIWDMDYASGAVRWSAPLEAQYGLRPGTFGGTFEAFIALVHPEDQRAVREGIANAARDRSDVALQFRTVWPDGTRHWINAIGHEYFSGDGTPVRGLGVSFDVTERHRLDEQSQQAQKMEVIGRLASGVAHDFNNLLTAILGYCELLLPDFPPGGPHRADLDEIQKAGMRAAGLTRQLLAFSRKQVIEPTVLDLSVVVAEMQAMLERLIGEDVAICLGLAPEHALVKADRVQVEQVVMNLAVNARDAMPTGGTLTIETGTVDFDEPFAQAHPAMTPGPYVVLTMTDMGTGMSSDVQAHLFEPFFTTKALGKGTGLGLATVQGIVAASGGSVGVYSELGRGTAFKVYFPRVAGRMAIMPPPAAPRAAGRAATVLVVDDADVLRELARRLLERQGYTVLLAANADEAVRLFDQEASIDLLLTDIVMPGASGPALTRQLVEQRPSLKVIFMSGYTEEAIGQHGVLKPGVAFLHKPFTSDTLGRKVREVLNR